MASTRISRTSLILEDGKSLRDPLVPDNSLSMLEEDVSGRRSWSQRVARFVKIAVEVAIASAIPPT